MTRDGLRDDWAYIQMQGRRSEFPFRYLTRYTALGSCPVSNCNKQFYPGTHQVDTLNTLIDGRLSTRVLEHGRRPQTELFGGAFRARGDGELMHSDASNQLVRKAGFTQRCGKPSSEMAYNRYDYIAFPNRAEWWSRGGDMTRVSPVYIKPVRM